MPTGYDVRGASAYVQTTTTSSVSTASPPLTATGCIISVDTVDARVTFDGSSPSSTAGHLVKAGQAYPWYVPIGTRPIKFCSTTGSATVFSVTWLFN